MSQVVKDLETQAYKFWKRGDYYVAYLIFHSLIEGALRHFLNISPDKELRFCDLIEQLAKFLRTFPYTQPESTIRRTTDTLTKFNRARNKIIHNLWRYGYRHLNQKCKRLAQQAYITFLLEVEYLGTFNEEFEEKWCVEYGTLGELEEWLKDYELFLLSKREKRENN